MKKLLTLAWVLAAAGMCTSIGAQDFDTKLKRFITITDNKYAPEISRDEAIKLGFTVNDYNRFVEYVGQLNVKAKRSLTLPQNRFINAFVEIDPNDGTLILNLPLEKAIRAGGTVEGYFQTIKVIMANDDGLSETDRQKRNDALKKIQKELLEFAIQNPDSSAVEKFFTPPPMPK